MFGVEVNYLSVFVAGVVAMAVGAVWYSPLLFAKPWLAAMGSSEQQLKKRKTQVSMSRAYGLTFLATLLMAFVLSVCIGYVDAMTIVEGAVVGFWLWLGFVATTLAATALFQGQPLVLYLINAGQKLVALAIMGSILAVWR